MLFRSFAHEPWSGLGEYPTVRQRTEGRAWDMSCAVTSAKSRGRVPFCGPSKRGTEYHIMGRALEALARTSPLAFLLISFGVGVRPWVGWIPG